MIELKEVRKSFGSTMVLKGVNLKIKDGRTTTIIGGSGSGKTVLFKHIIGLMKPDAGEIWVDGQDITRLAEKDRYRMIAKFGMVFQNGALFDSLSVGDNVAFGIPGKDRLAAVTIAKIIEECLSLVGLPDIARLMPAELSGGMRKRVSIARVIAKQPEIIMYDEPTTGLDPIMADIITNLIVKISGDSGTTTIVITHDLKSAYKISDQIAVLYDGRIIETGTADHIRHSDNEIVRQFIEGRAEGPIKIR